jgi:hypothetical protein
MIIAVINTAMKGNQKLLPVQLMKIALHKPRNYVITCELEALNKSFLATDPK